LYRKGTFRVFIHMLQFDRSKLTRVTYQHKTRNTQYVLGAWSHN